MRKALLSFGLLLVLPLTGCDDRSTTDTTSQSTAQAQELKRNNESLIQNLRKLEAFSQSVQARAAAGRTTAADDGEAPYAYEEEIDFSALRSEIVSALRVNGACEGWIRLVTDILDLIADSRDQNFGDMSQAEIEAWANQYLTRYRALIACLEPLVADANLDPDDLSDALDLMHGFDRCVCGSAGGSIFGSSAALVYSLYGAPSTGDAYSAPGSAAPDTYSAPGSAGGETYGAPALFP